MSNDSFVIKAINDGQRSFIKDYDPGYILYEGGLGSGKTFASAHHFLGLHYLNDRSWGLAVAPTMGDIWRFVAPAIQDACENLDWPYSVHALGKGTLKVPHIMVWGRPILLMSADEPSRFAGFEVGHLWCDEGARYRENVENPLRDAPTQIRTRLRCNRAKVLQGCISTTPEGESTWIERDFHTTPKTNYRSYRGSTLDNKHLPADYIDSLLSSLPAELVDQYIAGKAVTLVAGRAHPSYTPAIHDISIDPDYSLPAHIGCDYNVSPMCWVLAQEIEGKVRFIDELVIDDAATVDLMVAEAHAKGWGKFPHVMFHVDKSSKNRSTTGDPEFTAMTQAAKEHGWNWSGDAYGSNPPINARLNLFSRVLKNAKGEIGVTIDPRCKRLREDLRMTARGSNGYNPGKDGKRGHILDGAGYLIWDLCKPLPSSGSSRWFGG